MTRRIRVQQDFTVKSSVAKGSPLTLLKDQVYDIGMGPSGIQVQYGTQAFYPLASDEYPFVEFL